MAEDTAPKHRSRLGTFIIVILVIGVIILLSVYGCALQQAGDVGTTVIHRGQEVLVGTGAGQQLSSVGSSIYDAIFNPETLFVEYSFESEVDNSVHKNLGLEITKFNTRQSSYKQGEPLSFVGTVKGSGLEDNLRVTAYCSLSEDSGTLKASQPIPATISSPIQSDNNGRVASLLKDIEQVFTVDCFFPNGVVFQTQQLAQKQVKSVLATLSVQYDFVTKASYKIYFLNGEELETLLMQSKDPFVEYKINDPMLNSDRTMKSKTTPGAINLGIGTEDSQPFREGRSYLLSVSLNQGQYGGEIRKLSAIKISVPLYVYLATDPEYDSPNRDSASYTCDYVATGQVDHDNFKIYTLKPDLLEKINTVAAISETDSRYKAFAEQHQEEIALYSHSIDTRCYMMVPSISAEGLTSQGLNFDYIRAEASYTHEKVMAKQFTVRADPTNSLSNPDTNTIYENAENYLNTAS